MTEALETKPALAVAAFNEARELLLLASDDPRGRSRWQMPQSRLAKPDSDLRAEACGALRDLAGFEAEVWSVHGDVPSPAPGVPSTRLFVARDLRPVAGFVAGSTREWVPLESAVSLLEQGLVEETVTGPALLLLRAAGNGPWGTGDLHALEARQQALEERVRELQLALTEALERDRNVIDTIDRRLSQALAETQSILHSGIWRTLTYVGRVARRLLGRSSPGALETRAAWAGTKELFQVRCDEPASDPRMPRSGRVRIRGWAVAASGIERVEVLAGTPGATPARLGLYRPDIAREFPQIENADRSGFDAQLDTTFLPDGVHAICVRAHSRSGQSVEVSIPILVDHVRGHADAYERWMRDFDRRDTTLIRLKLPLFREKPLVTVLMPLYETNPRFLDRAIQSVRDQSYSHWELVAVDDGSKSPELEAILRQAASEDGRIRVEALPENQGIAAASNHGLGQARGEWVALLDHDDELAPDALYHVVDAINAQPNADIFYSDEDHIDATGVRQDPFFKPDWSPDLILQENYVCHLVVFRRTLGEAVGGLRSDVDTAQDHDLLLRMSLRARQIVHIPRILYHWRSNVDSDVSNRASFQTDKALMSSRRSVEDYLKLAGSEARVEEGRWPGRWRIRYPIPEGLEVLILMPTAGKLDVLRRGIDSIVDKTEYPRYRFAFVDNSKNRAAEQFLIDWGRRRGREFSYVDWRNRSFDFSAMNNALARRALAALGSLDGRAGPLLLFLNDDIEVIRPEWLGSMVELAARPEVGVVGAKLLYPDDRIQHAGVVVGLFGVAGHGWRGYPDGERIYYDFPDMVRNVSAVTGACLMIRSDLFHELGGFDAESLPVAYQDIDLCLKVRERGLRILQNPYALLYHYEAISKAPQDLHPRPEEARAFKTRWAKQLQADPFYNPNLSTASEDYSFRVASSAV